jgi:sulfur carrier protein
VAANLKINGQEKTFDEGLPATLSTLLEKLKIDAATVVAEIDGQIIERKNFTQTNLAEGQSIELIRFVGGG